MAKSRAQRKAEQRKRRQQELEERARRSQAKELAAKGDIVIADNKGEDELVY